MFKETAIDEEGRGILPPLKVNIELNVMGSTVKTYDNAFKKTFTNSIGKKKGKDDDYLFVNHKY